MHSVPVLLIAFCVVLSVNAFIDLEALVEALTPGPCKSCKDIGNFLREMDLNREELEEMVEYQCDIHATNPYVANVCKSSERIIEEFEVFTYTLAQKCLDPLPFFSVY
ncbi:unnamed protein product [Heligmosomoides polygyrus]|uniref:Saposin B-type domain-containing protein n=1 Tax=Heligmosomoides polygyrus TaxID=6339 RepID=A0A183G4H0_HELPZ|nr:unnamed protein product [Heligmosomoides polygyrus]